MPASHPHPHSRQRRPVARPATLLAIGLALAALASCTSTAGGSRRAGPGTAAPGRSATANARAARAEAAAKAALAAYDNYRREMVKASATANADDPNLSRYLGDPLLTEERLNLMRMKQQGLIMVGQPRWHANVTAVNVDTSPYTVQINDCLDNSGWNTVHAATGTSAQLPGQNVAYPVSAQAELYSDGRWLINQGSADRSRTC